jgi:hypothetical protein
MAVQLATGNAMFVGKFIFPRSTAKSDLAE